MNYLIKTKVKVTMPKKLSFNFVRSEFEKEGYNLLEDSYINAHTKLNYICSKKHKGNITWNNWKHGHRCSICGIDLQKETKLNCYGNKNYNNMEKNRQTKLKKYGNKSYNNPQKNKETSLRKYGTEHHLQNKTILDKLEETNLRKYGVRQLFSSENFRLKSVREKYGVDNVMQIPEVIEKQQKNAFKRKEYILPSGNIIYLQGYENLAFDLLLSNYNENDLIHRKGDVPNIFYLKNSTKHRYYPDIYIPKENLIIEVKSVYHFYNQYDLNMSKRQACFDNNYYFLFIIFFNNDHNNYIFV